MAERQNPEVAGLFPFAGDYLAAFHRAHEQRYGYSDRARSCEVVNIRARFSGSVPKPDLPKLRIGGSSPARAVVNKTNVLFSGRKYPTTIYDRGKLQAGNRIFGPAIVTEYSATTAILPLWTGHIDSYGNLILEPRR